MCDQVVARVPGSGRAALQSADIILTETPTLTGAAWRATSLFARFPGCLVVAVRHEGGRWCVLSVRDKGSRLLRPGFGDRVGWAGLATRAVEAHTRAVTS